MSKGKGKGISKRYCRASIYECQRGDNRASRDPEIDPDERRSAGLASGSGTKERLVYDLDRVVVEEIMVDITFVSIVDN